MGIGKNHPLGSQFIHVRRPGLRVALQHARPVIQIIDGDEEDIGLLLSLLGGVRYQAKQQNGQNLCRSSFHLNLILYAIIRLNRLWVICCTRLSGPC